MPRLDLFRAVGGSDEDPLEHSYRSGFWGTVRIGPRTNGELNLSLRANLAGGATSDGRARDAPDRRTRACHLPTLPPAADPLVAICMATHEPPMDLFRRQVESIRAQTHRELDLHGERRLLEPRALRRAGGGAGRRPALRGVALAQPARLLRQLRARPRDGARPTPSSWRWPTRTTSGTRTSSRRCSTAIGTAQLAYSDARLVTPDGELLADTYWALRRNNHTSISSLLMANSVTGAASLLRRDLLDYALPFPPAQFAHFHDHWIALTALALGEIEFVDRPLYDYTQHDAAVLGHAAANRRTEMRERVAKARRGPARAGAALADALLRGQLPPEPVRHRARDALRRPDGPREAPRAATASPRRRRSLTALARLGLRAVRELAGTPRTLGAEVGLFFAFLWRRLVALSAGRGQRPKRRAAPGRRAAAQPRPEARAARARGRGAANDRREDRAAGAARARRRAGAGEPADPDDRPEALLRRLHREVQPGAPAGRARAPACGS